MRSQPGAGGAGLTPSVFTYTAAMRAALTGSMLDRAMQVGAGRVVGWEPRAVGGVPQETLHRRAKAGVPCMQLHSSRQRLHTVKACATPQQPPALCVAVRPPVPVRSDNKTCLPACLPACPRYGTTPWAPSARSTAGCAPRWWRSAGGVATPIARSMRMRRCVLGQARGSRLGT